MPHACDFKRNILILKSEDFQCCRCCNNCSTSNYLSVWSTKIIFCQRDRAGVSVSNEAKSWNNADSDGTKTERSTDKADGRTDGEKMLQTSCALRWRRDKMPFVPRTKLKRCQILAKLIFIFYIKIHDGHFQHILFTQEILFYCFYGSILEQICSLRPCVMQLLSEAGKWQLRSGLSVNALLSYVSVTRFLFFWWIFLNSNDNNNSDTPDVYDYTSHVSLIRDIQK